MDVSDWERCSAWWEVFAFDERCAIWGLDRTEAMGQPGIVDWRRELSSRCKTFRKLTPDKMNDCFVDFLKGVQIDVDALARRAIKTENALLRVVGELVAAPNPAVFLQAGLIVSQEANRLAVELENARASKLALEQALAEANSQRRELNTLLARAQSDLSEALRASEVCRSYDAEQVALKGADNYRLLIENVDLRRKLDAAMLSATAASIPATQVAVLPQVGAGTISTVDIAERTVNSENVLPVFVQELAPFTAAVPTNPGVPISILPADSAANTSTADVAASEQTDAAILLNAPAVIVADRAAPLNSAQPFTPKVLSAVVVEVTTPPRMTVQSNQARPPANDGPSTSAKPDLNISGSSIAPSLKGDTSGVAASATLTAGLDLSVPLPLELETDLSRRPLTLQPQSESTAPNAGAQATPTPGSDLVAGMLLPPAGIVQQMLPSRSKGFFSKLLWILVGDDEDDAPQAALVVSGK